MVESQKKNGCGEAAETWHDFCFSTEQLTTLRGLVKQQLGVNISEEKNYLLMSKFSKLMVDAGLSQVSDLIKYLLTASAQAKDKMARFLTTNHTFFFREPKHLDVLCCLIKNKKLRRPKIWCAASSTGEEVYSIAISLLESGITDFTILASDINLDVLKVCRSGLYRPDRLREMPEKLLTKYFDQMELGGLPAYRVKSWLSTRLILKRINLTENFRFEQEFDYIFCRNVMIYFDHQTQERVVAGLLRNLVPSGVLFVGLSEPLINMDVKVKTIDTSVYQKTG